MSRWRFEAGRPIRCPFNLGLGVSGATVINHDMTMVHEMLLALSVPEACPPPSWRHMSVSHPDSGKRYL